MGNIFSLTVMSNDDRGCEAAAMDATAGREEIDGGGRRRVAARMIISSSRRRRRTTAGGDGEQQWKTRVSSNRR